MWVKSTLRGKLADFVILDKNPLKVDPMAIKDIKIVETIKEEGRKNDLQGQIIKHPA